METVLEVLYEQVAAEVNGTDLMNGELNEEGDEQNGEDTGVSPPSSPSRSVQTTPVTPKNTNLRVSVYVHANTFHSFARSLRNLCF